MKIKSLIITAALTLACAIGATATQPTTPQIPVKGTLAIQFKTRENTPVQKGVRDIYSVNIAVATNTIFTGTITDLPQIIEGMFSKEVTQRRQLSYDLSCTLSNPKNLAQTYTIGTLAGKVNIDSDGTYRYDTGNLTMSILPINKGAQLSDTFRGTAIGKPQGRPSNWMDTLKCTTVNITRNINGKTSTISLNKYDKMDFRQHVIASGPLASYPSVTVNGEMLYDYSKECWFLNNITMQYADAGVIRIDRLTGTIRWEKKSNEYAFDVRVNEPAPSATTAFEPTAPVDESAFFETDTTIPALVGSMKYKDVKRGDTVLRSDVTIDLTGNNLTKSQVMALTKMILFSAVVPMNSD